MIRNCGLCSKIYNGFDDYIKHDPLCSGAAIVKHRDEDSGNYEIVFYVPCKDSFYDKWFEINYCPNCGKLINNKYVVYR